MHQIHKCPHGHTWEGVATACPTCAAAAESRGGADSSTFVPDLADELPPPPGVNFPTLATEKPNLPAPGPAREVPTIPGYAILRELGRGGMGIVYEARHLALNRRVALKVIRSAGYANTGERMQFRAEAEAVATLQHPNIVQVHEVGEYDGLPYLTLELVEGGNLSSRLRVTTLTPRPAAELVSTLARAIQHAHSRGIIHRDLKPANVLVHVDFTAEKAENAENKTSRIGIGSSSSSALSAFSAVKSLIPKITDFGLAKRIGGDEAGRSLSGQVMGTPAYMAPEQAAGQRHRVGPPTDVWALGAILYECLTARVPFPASTASETIQKVLHAEPTPPGRVRSGVPRDLETICLKCLHKDPDRRYRTAGDLADDLDRFLTGRPVLARRTPWVERCWKWSKRRPAAALLAFVSIGAAAALGVLCYRYFRDLERYNLELQAKNETISRNNLDLEEKNATISQNNLVIARERDRAEENLLSAIDAVDQMLTQMGLVGLAAIPHIDRDRAILLEHALKFYDRLLGTQQNDPRLRTLKALTLQRSGSILMLLGRYPVALARFDEALALFADLNREANAAIPPATLIQLEARVHNERGLLFVHTHEVEKARIEQETALTLREKLLAGDPGNPLFRYQVACSQLNLSFVARVEGDWEKVKLHLGRAQSLAESLAGKNPDNKTYAFLNAIILNNMAVCRIDDDEPNQAVPVLEAAVGTWRRLLKASPDDVDYRAEMAQALGNLGVAWRMQGYLKRATEMTMESVGISEKLAGDHPEVVQFQVDLCWKYFQAGEVVRAGDLNQSASAIEWFDKAIDRLEKLPGRDSRARDLTRHIHVSRASTLILLEDYQGAANDFGKAAVASDGEQRADLRIKKAAALASGGEAEKALAETDDVLKTENAIPTEARFVAGLVMARAAKATAEPTRAEKLTLRAIEQLSLAETGDYFRDPKHRNLLDRHPDLAILRGRTDFDTLRAKVKRP